MSERQGDTRQFAMELDRHIERPDIEVKPAPPSKQCQQVLDVLSDHQWHTPLYIVRETYILSHTKRISELRRLGHNIEMRWHVNKEGRKDYTEYRLVENA